VTDTSPGLHRLDFRRPPPSRASRHALTVITAGVIATLVALCVIAASCSPHPASPPPRPAVIMYAPAAQH
jgi:hypothetical protein